MHKIIKVPYRLEQKYLIDKVSAHKILTCLEGYLQADKNTDDEDSYKINSIYFDDPEFSSYFQKIDGVFNKIKVRLRWYGESTKVHNFFLETKFKEGRINFKEREVIDLKRAREILDSTYLICSAQAPGSHYLKIKSGFLKPVCLVSYHRKAYFVKTAPDVRITIDTDIRAGRPFIDQKFTTPILDGNLAILEIKSRGFIDEYIQKVVSRYALKKISFSKYKEAADAVIRFKL